MAERDFPKVSIVLTHFAMNEFRSEKMRECVNSLIETTEHLPVEIIVVDNGGNYSDSEWLLRNTSAWRIACYIYNRKNMHFYYARNQGLKMATGEYICISDNDILYKEGWLERCIGMLEAHPDRKIAVTPLKTDRQHRNVKYWAGEIEHEGKKYLVNKKAGSNCWVMRKKDFYEIGEFKFSPKSGSLWADDFVNKGYLVATLEEAPLTPGQTFPAEDLAFRRGYNFRTPIENTEL